MLTDKLEYVSNLILMELKFIRSDIKAEVQKLCQEIKLLHCAKEGNDKHSSLFNSSKLHFSDACPAESTTFKNASFHIPQDNSEEIVFEKKF